MVLAVHVLFSMATLLSGGVDDCLDANDTTCEAGIAAVSALNRNISDPSLVIQRADLYSPFVQMHELKWNVNKKVISDHFGWNVFTSTASIVSGAEDNVRDFEGLQTNEMPLLLSNVAVPPSNQWSPFVEHIHFDQRTKLAVQNLVALGQSVTRSQIDSALGLLDYIARLNQGGAKWIPVVYFTEPYVDHWQQLVDALTNHTNPPALLVDNQNNDNERFAVPRLVGQTWVASYREHAGQIRQFKITADEETLRVQNVDLIRTDLTNIPPELNDETYAKDIAFLRTLANDAALNNPVVGYTETMPIVRDNGDLRRCMGGECQIGNLFMDALRWYTKADFAFANSGGLRGPGWEAGPVRVGDIWNALPFANSVCQGTLSGISLFRLFNYSTNMATFLSTYTPNGDRLLQVSGLKYTYNTELKKSRLINIQIWDDEAQDYKEIDRLRLYTFATDSFICDIFDPFPSLLKDLNIEGEVPALTDPDSKIHQFIVADYLTAVTSEESPLHTSIQGRLVNSTNSTEALNLIQTKDLCPPNTAWEEPIQTCVPCVDTGSNVVFSDKSLTFETTSGTAEKLEGRILLVNRELYAVSAAPHLIPSWVNFPSLDGDSVAPIPLESGESVALEFLVRSPTLEAGTSVGTVSFSVVGGIAGCAVKDARFEIFLRAAPQEDATYLGEISYVGFSLMTVIQLSCLLFGAYVISYRSERIVKTHQPPFLLQICVGVFVMGSAIAPLSLDDGIVSEVGCNIACMAFPWLWSIGFTISFSALFSKLWRINRLFSATITFQRVQVGAKDVMKPFLILLGLNLIILSVWTGTDPLRWERRPKEGAPWKTFGACYGSGRVSDSMMGSTISINAGALALVCLQAYRARNISDEFSESKYLGIALFSWLQVLVVGGPVLFLIGRDDPRVTYILVTTILFVVCMSMLLLIFVPMIIHQRTRKENDNASLAFKRMSGVASGVSTGYGKTSMTDESAQMGNRAIERTAMMNRLDALSASIARLKAENQGLAERNVELEETLAINDAKSYSFDEQSFDILDDLENEQSSRPVKVGPRRRPPSRKVSNGLEEVERVSRFNISGQIRAVIARFNSSQEDEL